MCGGEQAGGGVWGVMGGGSGTVVSLSYFSYSPEKDHAHSASFFMENIMSSGCCMPAILFVHACIRTEVYILYVLKDITTRMLFVDI